MSNDLVGTIIGIIGAAVGLVGIGYGMSQRDKMNDIAKKNRQIRKLLRSLTTNLNLIIF